MAQKQAVVSMLSLAAWLAVLLGLAVQLLILIVKIAVGGKATSLQVLGGVILWLNHSHAVAAGSAMPAARLAAICVNELMFPVGCAIVIYFVARFADRRSALERLAAGGG